MAMASWNGTVIAQSDEYEIVEGNVYFPPDSIKQAYFSASKTTSFCPWKGEAHYYHVQVDGKTNKDAAWYYPAPKKKAGNIKNHVAFWRGVQVSK